MLDWVPVPPARPVTRTTPHWLHGTFAVLTAGLWLPGWWAATVWARRVNERNQAAYDDALSAWMAIRQQKLEAGDKFALRLPPWLLPH